MMTGENKPGMDQLHNSGNFRLVKSLRHDEVVHFVVRQLKVFRWPMLTFYGIIIALLLLIISFSIYNFFSPVIFWKIWFLHVLYGILAGMIFVIPVHEGLHGLAYWFAGAKRIKYGMDLSQMLFYASAPGFIAGRSAFMMVAFFPFAIISLIFTAGIIFGQPPLQWGSLVALFIHSILCIGDFAMVNYLASFPGQKLYTYDDAVSKISYFFIRR